MKKLVIFVLLATAVIYYFGGYYKPVPKVGEVIFNVPDLITRDIDEIMGTYRKSSGQYADSVVTSNGVYKRDENSTYSIYKYPDGISNTSAFDYFRDGWHLIVSFDAISRKIEYIYRSRR